jgi:hypothetical protein
MSTHIQLGNVGEITANATVECSACCYTIGGTMPTINGTHMINGTDVFAVTPAPVGYYFGTGNIILPCSVNSHANIVYYQASSAKVVSPKIYLCALGLIAMIIVGM